MFTSTSGMRSDYVTHPDSFKRWREGAWVHRVHDVLSVAATIAVSWPAA